MHRKPLALAFALASATLLLGCDGLDTSNDDLPPPAIFAADDVVACGTPGTLAITLDLTSARVVQGAPLPPASLAHRVEVSGTVAGLGGDQLFALLLDDVLDCPLIASAPVTVAADGSFRIAIGIGTSEEFRVVAVAGPAGAAPQCGADCVQMDAAGTIVSLTGRSNAIGVRLQ